MDITTFIHSQRQAALLLGDYNAYRTTCSRRLATLRNRLGRSTAKKYSAPPPLTPDDIAKDPSYAHLLLFASERAWAHGMHLKSITSDDPASASRSARTHLVSRLHKAQKHAFELCSLLRDAAAGGNDVLEATAYATSLLGSELFERSQWERALGAFSCARIVYSVLSAAASSKESSELYKDQLSATIDPSVRYSAYQLQLPRNLDIASITRQYFPRESYPHIVVALESVDSQVFAEPSERSTASGTVTSVTWRSRTAPIEDPDISVALSNAQTAEATYSAQGDNASADAYDEVLSSWQDVVTVIGKAVEESNLAASDLKMQNLQLIFTYANNALITWRISRNRKLISDVLNRKDDKKGRSRLAHLKEAIALYDAILQSLATVLTLPGVAGDAAFSAEVEARTALFRALRLAAIARSHAAIEQRKEALALFARASGYADAAQKGLQGDDPDAELAGQLREELDGQVFRYRALVEMDNETTRLREAAQRAPKSGVYLDRLDQWPAEPVDWSRLVSWPPKVVPVPVKPLFLDIAWNFIEYPGVKDKRAQTQQQQQQQAEAERKGLLGRLWGR